MGVKARKNIAVALLHIVVGAAAILTILPFVWMIGASFMQTGEASTFPPKLWSDSATLKQYIFLFERMNLKGYFLNSLVLASGVTVVSLIVNSMAGFAFAKYSFRGKNFTFKLLLSSMIIPGQVTMLPVFLLLNKMGLLNSYFGIILPGMASIFGIFLIRQYLSSISDSLLEAAWLDGANDFYIYWKIIIPLSMPILVTLALFTFMGTWNDFLWPLIVMSDENMYTLPVALANLSKEFDLDPELMMAGSVVTVLPVVILFLMLQKYYIRGILLGGVKG